MPLVLERTIALPEVAGRIDHLSIDLARKHLFVAEVGNGTVDVIDLESKRQTGAWTVPYLNANFPLAIDASGALLAAVFRSPARLVLLDTKSGVVVANLATCNDAADVYFDANRKRIYISCGAGAVDVFQNDGADTHLVAQLSTPPGGRTALFVPELDRLFVAVRARLLRSDASILVFRPMP